MPARIQYHLVPQHKFSFARTWGVSLGWWSVGAGAMALYMLSTTPVVKRGILSKLPVLGDYYTDKTPASDKPF